MTNLVCFNFRFKWTHLSERLAYERASHSQKMRAEVSQAKREADFFRSNVEKSRKMLKRVKTDNSAAEDSGRLYEFRQKETDAVLRSKRAKSEDEQSHHEDRPDQQLARKGKKSKKGKKEVREAAEASARNRKKTKKSAVDLSEASPAKRARTRSSDRREFLKSVFGAKT